MDRIETIGFDMDYTLARYTEAMESLQAELALARLVERCGYPRAVLEITYDPTFAIRGLTVDLAEGNVLKMDSHRFVGRVWHGAGPLARKLRREIYTNHKVSPRDASYVMVDTLFSLPEISLYSQLVAHLDALPEGDSRPTYERLWRDLRQTMDSLHRDGSLKTEIRRAMAHFVFADPDLADTLHRFRSAGKRLFLLTNSEPEYTDAVMRFLLDGKHAAYASWMDYFDFAITAAMKPHFFTGDTPLVEIGPDGSPLRGPVTALHRGLYAGGNLGEFRRLAGIMGDEVLYVGDHIYGDILRSKLDTHWRTAMVIQEMDRELGEIETEYPSIDELSQLDARRVQCTLELAARALDGDRATALRGELRELGRAIATLERRTADAFNPYWGMLFRDRGELSAFGAQVKDFACVYTSRASNFRLYSPQWYFRSPGDRMAHEHAL